MPEGAGNGASPVHRTRTIIRDGVALHVVEAGHGFPVVLVHGFPDTSYTWRHQLPALAREGYRAVAIDQRGCGRSGRPDAVEAYDVAALTGDLLHVLDDLGEDRAVFVGHGAGALTVWALAQLAPDRVAAVVALATPFLPRGTTPPTALLRQFAGDRWFHLLYVQEPGVAEADLGRDVRTTMLRTLAGLRAASILSPRRRGDRRGIVDRLHDVRSLPPWLTPDDLDHYVDEFTRTGFTGGLNWFRNIDRNWALTAHLAGATVTVPSLFVAGADDDMSSLHPPSAMRGWLDDHRGTILVDGARHWVHQEKPDEVNTALLAFLAQTVTSRTTA